MKERTEERGEDLGSLIALSLKGKLELGTASLGAEDGAAVLRGLNAADGEEAGDERFGQRWFMVWFYGERQRTARKVVV